MKLPHFIAALAVCVAGLGIAALLRAQNTEGPLQRFFGSPPKKQGPPSSPTLREDAYHVVEILVELSWLSDPITFPYYIEARVVGAKLQVRGNVPSKAVREQAIKLAGLNCPMTVVDMLKENPHIVYHPARLNPDQLQKVATSGLREALPKTKNLQARCSADGRVAVTGTVDLFEEKLIVSQTIRRLHGATSATNLVRVSCDPDGSLARSLVRLAPTASTDAANLPALPGPEGPPAIVQGNTTLPPAEQIPLPVLPANTTVVAGSSPVGKVEPAPPSPAKNVSKANLANLKKLLEKSCPGAKQINITQEPSGKLQIDVHARKAGDNKQLVDKLFAVRELVDNFEFELRIYDPER